MSTRLAQSLDTVRPHYDVVIIGSGYGGGVAASRLARAGKRVCVLERGREFVTGEFPARFPEMRNEMRVTARSWKTGPAAALYDVRIGADIHVLVGCGVGGGSLVNAGVALRPDARVFADEIWPGQIRQDGLLDEGYARALAWLQPAADPRAAERTKYKSLEHCGPAIANQPVAPQINVAFAERVNAAGITQPACAACGDCCGGCNVGAKTTVALTYLPDAVRSGAEIFTHARVDHVERIADGGWRVHIERLDKPAKGNAAVGTVTVDAAIVVLSAGTLGSSEILLRSRAKGLAVSSRLGERFSANGDIIAFGYGAKIPISSVGVGHPAKVPGMEIGAAVSGQIEISDADHLDNQMIIQEGALPSALAPMLPVMFVPNGRLLGALQSLVSGVYKGPFQHLQTFFAVSHDSASGKMALEDDQLALTWPGVDKEPVYKRMDASIGALVTKAGGSYVRNPLAGTVMGHQPATAHPLGGVAMGREAADGVVNHKGEVFDTALGQSGTAVHDGLYVIDGSVIPRSLGCNPLLTITALAERALIHMARDRGFVFDAAPAPAGDFVSVQTPGAFRKTG